MLGLFSGSHGHEPAARKSNIKEPVVTEIVPGHGSDGEDSVDGDRETASLQKPLTTTAPFSPSPSAAHSVRLHKRTSMINRTVSSIRTSLGRFTNPFVREQHSIIRDRCQRELGSTVGKRAFDTSFDGLRDWIKAERLTRLPHKGGSWDRVLISAQYFAEQVKHLNQHVESFTEESGAATNFVFGQCLVLLELGHENAHALEKAFDLFYQFGLELAPLLKRGNIFVESQSIMENLGKAFADLLQIVTGVSITFHQAVHSGRASTKLDIFSSFSSVIENFRSRVHKCAHEMWSIILAEYSIDGCDVKFLQKWLAPEDSVIAFLSSNNVSLSVRPEEFTCTWFQPHLSSFLKGNNNILLVEGKAGSGKTTLANWTVDRLQRPIGRKHVSTLSFFFDYNVMALETPLAMIRTLLHQLLAQRIGDVLLFKAVNDAYLESKGLLTAEQQEAKMWSALARALAAVNEDPHETLAIIVDGIYETDGQKSAVQKTCQQLYDLANKFAAVRLIQFSQPMGVSPNSTERVQLSADNMSDDLNTVVRHKISVLQHFKDRDYADQENIIEQIVEASDGSMLWASMTCKYLRLQDSCKEFDAALKAVIDAPKTIIEAVKRQLLAVKLSKDSKTLLSLLVTAERPLQLAEVGALLRADLEELAMDERSVDVGSAMAQISAFIITGEGLITLRHSLVKQAIIGSSSDSRLGLHLKDRHRDFVARLFIYTKSCLRSEHEATIVCLESEHAESRLQAHHLLEYAVRYWTVHFKKSSLFKAQGDLQLPQEFKKIFPASVSFCMLEQACWDAQSFAHEALELHTLAFRVRKALFGQNHSCVLQSALFCALLCENVLRRHTEAIEWYALAAKIAKVVIGVQAEITISCCTIVLRLSEAFITKKRTTIMTYREEILLVLVSSYKHRFGEFSKEVLEIYKRLEELYICIEEETKRVEIIKIIEKITISIGGSGHTDQAQLITRKAVVDLKKHEHEGEIELFDGFLFGGYKEECEEQLTLVQVEIIIKLAAKYVIDGAFEKAEELYIELWLKLTEHCHSVNVCEWHEKKIQVLLIYARSLEKQHRHSEANALLLAIWSEYEHHEFSMFESVVILLKEVAICMKALGMLTVALTVFRKCWSFFKHQHKEKHVVFTEIEEYILHTSKEVVKTTTTTVTSTSSETIIREVFESTFESSETTVSTTTVELCQSLTKIYFREERYSEAITCIRKLLSKSWASFFCESIESITMVEHFSSESIKLVIDLAVCYINQKRFEKAEEIYLRLYRAHRKHCKIEDVAIIKYSEMLLAFYAKHELFTKAISFYQELLVDYRACYGITHAMTIKILYALGDLCREHHVNYGYWLEYYLEIVVNLNKGAVTCHKDAFRALIIVAEHYYETLRFSESLLYFKCIFATFCKFGTEFKYFEDIIKVKLLIAHYFRCLEESKIEIHIHISILKELRKACIEYYGESSEITISCLVMLAEVCCRHEKFEYEAISYYEHIVKHSKTVHTEIIKKTQTTLRTLYVKQITKKETTITKETIERATILLYEKYVEIRKSHSCSHELTLTHLRELILFYHRQKKIELSLKELKTIIIECITKVKSARELIESAKFIAAIYIGCGFVSEGLEIIRELKLQLIYELHDGCKHHGFDVTKIGRSCFAFIASFEYHLRAVYSVTIAMYMADLVAEAVFYAKFKRYVKSKSKLELIFVTGARLRQIMVRTKRLNDFGIIERMVLDYFRSHETSITKSSTDSSVRVFVNVLLEYFSEHSASKSWTATAGHAAVHRLNALLKQNRHEEALELATCTFRFLMAHEGLDDPTEITLGFQLCLMMADRTEHKHKNVKPATKKAMMELSRKILAEVFDICKREKINIARCHLSELKELVILVGEHKDYEQLRWLLRVLWASRESQSQWSPETILYLGKRLVQVEFTLKRYEVAIKLCEDIVYNVRRVHGLRHHHTLSFHALLASMFTSLAIKFREESLADGTKNKKRAEERAQIYFKKAVHVHEEVLKLIINQDDADVSDCDDDDLESELADGTASYHGSVIHGHHGDIAHAVSFGFAWTSKEQEIDYVRAHIRRLQLAVQRYGGFPRPAKEYENLTAKVYGHYGKHLSMPEDHCLSKKWKIDGFGGGKAEGDLREDGFLVPESWWIVKE